MTAALSLPISELRPLFFLQLKMMKVLARGSLSSPLKASLSEKTSQGDENLRECGMGMNGATQVVQGAA